MQVPSLASLSGLRIQCCHRLQLGLQMWLKTQTAAWIQRGYGCGIAQQLQLCFDPWPGNFRVPWVQQPLKKKKQKKASRLCCGGLEMLEAA